MNATAHSFHTDVPRPNRFRVAHNLLLAATLCLTLNASGGDLLFRRHLINDVSDSEFMSAAVYDVNKDGILDIACGGFWYEGPDWKRHFLRKVELSGRPPRPDGYAHQPLDVNGDGWTDIVTANYRTRSLKWIEHPGAKLGEGGEWTAHTIATPGPSETGRIVDLLGDGTPVLLPSGAGFAAWWELVRRPATGDAGPEWIRHELPREISGHNIGFGDINGDGRGDIVGSRGWAEAPEDRRTGEWIWHPEFRLSPGTIALVVDVNGDGLNDVLWCHGHDYGVYWNEQGRGANNERTWIQHTIDTSWAGAHAMLWEDLDGDGAKELIVGRRYMAHEGNDPGEYDPQACYRFQYDPRTRTWRRWLIGYNDGIGFGLDPKAVDVNRDGRLDLVLAGRHGLYYLENMGPGNAVAKGETRDPLWFPAYTDHLNLMVVKDEAGVEKLVENPFDWGQRRAQTLAAMQKVLGELPDSHRRAPLDVNVVNETAQEGYTRRKITYVSDAASRVSAYLLIPAQPRPGGPAMLCLHDDVRSGKDGPAGLGGRESPPFAVELAKRGYVCLVPDYPAQGESTFDFRGNRDAFPSGSMKAVWDNLRGLDLLQAMPEVDARRIGVIGHGTGGMNALFTAALDHRVAAIVASCGFTTFSRMSGEKLSGLAADRFMPRIREVYGNDAAKLPFDFAEVLATLAPRGVFVSAPTADPTLGIEGVKDAVTAALKVYELRGAEESLQVTHPDAAREFPETTRIEAYTWLDQRLSGSGGRRGRGSARAREVDETP